LSQRLQTVAAGLTGVFKGHKHAAPVQFATQLTRTGIGPLGSIRQFCATLMIAIDGAAAKVTNQCTALGAFENGNEAHAAISISPCDRSSYKKQKNTISLN
jgi:hypothetical protein